MQLDLLAIWRAGFVRRWHTNPDLSHTVDRIDGHAARVAKIIFALHPDPSVELIRAALVHDDGESVVGDIPQTFKERCGEAWADALERTEYLASVDLWGHWRQALDRNDLAWLKLADHLDAYMWAAHHAPRVLDGDGWPEARRNLIAMASGLAPQGQLASQIDRLLSDMEAR